jgi:ubiquinone/menaquinone biosynthesis C-methylase UbiE
MSQKNWYVDYDQVAPTFDKRYTRNEYADVEHALRQFIGSQPEQQILEVGCGTGHWRERLHTSELHVTGLDYSAGMLAGARMRLPGLGLIHGRAEHLPWPAESFDRVFCINAIHHFADKPAFLAEVQRILHPGGRFLSVGLDPHSGTDQWHIYDYFKESLDIDRQRYPSSGTLREWMSAAGFEDCLTQEAEHWIIRLPAREALAQGRLEKAATSQLSVLTDAEYQQGIQRIRAEMERMEAKGETLFLTVDLRLYGTSGSVAKYAR